MTIHTRAHMRALLTGAAAACVLMATPALAQDHVQRFDIPAEDGAAALNDFARQAGVQIVFPYDAVQGRRAPAVNGELTRAQALAALASALGLEVSSNQNGVVTLREPQGFRGSATATAASEVSELVVTGSHLKGVPPTSPVISFERREIENGGYTSVQDLMARVPQNFSGTTPATGTGGGNVGLTTQIDLRGLGSQSTLTLVNGRRAAGAAGNEGKAFDIGMIPVSAIERVDVLTDGASAIYGSDAIGGVVNLQLRKTYDGAETSAQYGSGEDGRRTWLVSQLLGKSWSSGHILLAGQYEHRDPVTASSFGLTSLDLRPRGGGDFATPGFGSPGVVYPAGYFAGQPFATIHGPGGAPVFFGLLPAGDGRNLQVADLHLNQSTEFGGVSVDAYPEQNNLSFYGTVEQEAGPVTLFADAIYARREGAQRLTTNFTYLIVPTSNAFSPFAEPVLVGYVFNELGPIVASPESEGWFANLGARGRFGQSSWTWEVVGSRSHDSFATDVTGINQAELNRRLASPDPTVAFNPFGDGSGQSPGVLDALRAQFSYHGVSTMTEGTAQAQGELVQLPGGPVKLNLGVEYRQEGIDTRASQAGVPDTVLFPHASRHAEAVFAEAYVPLVGEPNARPGVQELALSLAGRYERYGDFGDTANPKIGVLWRPAADLVLKANWGTSFRAPSLNELYSVSRVFHNYGVLDANAPGGPRQMFVDYITGGNPGLDPEKADTYTISGGYRPGWFPGAWLDVDYYHTNYRDRIHSPADGLTPAFLVSIEDSLPPGVIQRAPDGTLVTLNLVSVNSARTTISGFDFAGGYGWDAGRLGAFDLSASATLVTDFSDELIDGAPVQQRKGTVGFPPKWRARAGLSWKLGDWGAAASVNHTDGLFNATIDPRIVERDVASLTTVDAQLIWRPARADGLLSGFTARLGATNLFNARPPFVDGVGYDPRNFILEGRTVYLRLTKSLGGGQ
jgi:outer membrane receptor protein involved in Fe transport